MPINPLHLGIEHGQRVHVDGAERFLNGSFVLGSVKVFENSACTSAATKAGDSSLPSSCFILAIGSWLRMWATGE
jgi:hypothetical protein